MQLIFMAATAAAAYEGHSRCTSFVCVEPLRLIEVINNCVGK